MHETQDDEVKSELKLAQLWHVVENFYPSTINDDWHKAVVNNILKDKVNVNHRVAIKGDTLFYERSLGLEDCTALHFVCYNGRDIDTFNKLLERGANFIARNAKGDTVIHSLLSFRDSIEELVPFIESVLSSHVKNQNGANPLNNDGISHLHGACIANHVDSLNLFLDSHVYTLVNQVTHSDCELYPAFTPLHFAVLNDSFEVAQILVNRGADVNAKNGSGMTPLDECFKSRFKIFRRLYCRLSKKEIEDYQYKLCQNEKLIKLLLNSGCDSAVGLSRLHIASTLKDLSLAEGILSQDDVDIDYAVPMESSSWAGYTAAHFAALNSIKAVKMLLRHGTKLEAQNAQGTLALAICLRDYKIQDVHDILASAEKWKSLCFSGGRTAFLDFLQATASADQFKLFLQNVAVDAIVPSESFVWQGCTMLYLAVVLAKVIKDDIAFRTMYDTSIVEKCLRVGHSVNVQNSRGESAIHLAFRLQKKNILQLLLEQLDSEEEVEDVVNQDNLSYLHIACAERNISLVEKLLRNSNPNVAYKGQNISFVEHTFVTGATPLHVVACNGAFEIAEMLLRHGANLHAMDNLDFTPIHCLMKPPDNAVNKCPCVDVLFRYLLDDPKDCVNNTIGLSYLHVASFYGNVQAVQKLVEIGSDVNAVIASEKQICKAGSMSLEKYSTCTPLHMAQATPMQEVIDLLIDRGADVFAKSFNRHLARFSANSNCPLDDITILRRFMSTLWDREDMQKSMEEKLGLTRLHVACCLKNEESVRRLLEDGVVNINAQMNKDSEIFAGCTPLHLLLTQSHRITFSTVRPVRGNLGKFTVSPSVQLLLDYGADVMLVDAKNNTAIHRLFKYRLYFSDVEQCKDLLLNAHRDFSVNPADEFGISHFHLACYWHEVDVVEKFLEHGSVDVNRMTEFFGGTEPGATPLHLALVSRDNPDCPKILRTVDLLLKYGADVAAKDVFGDTPLHKFAAMVSPHLSIFNKLVSHGADIKTENVKGQTPLDKTSFEYNSYTIDWISLLKKCNYRINSWNRMTGEGNIGRILSLPNRIITESPEFKELLQSADVKEVDEMGRTAIHNAVATTKSTHCFTENVTSEIEKLVALGINVDHQDTSGQTALHYAAPMENKPGVGALLKCGADVNIVDSSKMSAFTHAFRDVYWEERGSYHWIESVARILHTHVQKLLYLRLEVNESNKNLSESARQILDPRIHTRYGHSSRLKESILRELEMSKTVDVRAASYVLFDFLSETNAITRYPFLLASNRNIIDNFFKGFDDKEFGELGGIVKLQHRKMKARLEMMDEALTALRTLLGFSLPGLCEEIVSYLPNSDLKNLIASTTEQSIEV